MSSWRFMGCGFQPKNTTHSCLLTARFTAVNIPASLDSIRVKPLRPNWSLSIIFAVMRFEPLPGSMT